jgi:predicted lipid-binding transport protein (Tim44 family)
MTREHEDLSPGCPEISAIEASLAQLRPRHQPRFADQVKNRMQDMLSGRTQPIGNVTATVRVPLTHYIRIARFQAAAGGLLVGLFLGMVLGGAGVFWALSGFEQATIATRSGSLFRTFALRADAVGGRSAAHSAGAGDSG